MSRVLSKLLAPHFPRFAAKLASGVGGVEHILPATSEDEILAIEETVGVPLPSSYKQFLRCTRGLWLFGGAVQFGTEHPFLHDFPALSTLTPAQKDAVQRKGGGWPPPSQGMMCFAEFFMEADGDQVLFDVKDGVRNAEYPVVYYAHEQRPPSVRILSQDFAAFLDGLLDMPAFQHDED